MKLKTHDYKIDIKMTPKKSTLELGTVIIIKAVAVNQEQALKIAEILYPDYIILGVKFSV